MKRTPFWRPAYEAKASFMWLALAAVASFGASDAGTAGRMILLFCGAMVLFALIRLWQAIAHWNRQARLVDHTPFQIDDEQVIALAAPRQRPRSTQRPLMKPAKRVFAYGHYGKIAHAFGTWLLEQFQEGRVQFSDHGELGLAHVPPVTIGVTDYVIRRYARHVETDDFSELLAALVQAGLIEGTRDFSRPHDGQLWYLTAGASTAFRNAAFLSEAPAEDHPEQGEPAHA